jgi:DNA-binding XRE family transcriptional regulator
MVRKPLTKPTSKSVAKPDRNAHEERWHTLHRNLEVLGRRQALMRHYADMLPEGRGKAIRTQPNDVRTAQIAFISQLIHTRRSLKLSQAQLAHKTGLTQATIARIETGQHSPGLNTTFAILAALSMQIELQPTTSVIIEKS